jgi:hypothetical protein
MSESNVAVVMVLLFALRCVVPLAIAIGLGYLMNRLVDHWEAEDTRKQARVPAPVPAAKPAPQFMLSVPCWVTFSCAEEARRKCPAYRDPSVPCWEARRSANGVLMARCADCPRDQAAFALAV